MVLSIELVTFATLAVFIHEIRADCPSRPDCEEIFCPLCAENSLILPPNDGECCPRCIPISAPDDDADDDNNDDDCPNPANCTGVGCPRPLCRVNYTLVPPKCGQCCPTCQPIHETDDDDDDDDEVDDCPNPVNCIGVRCPRLLCRVNYTLVPPKHGQCCPTCQPIHETDDDDDDDDEVDDCPNPVNCIGVRCPRLLCRVNYTLVPPKCGQCCPTCQPIQETNGSCTTPRDCTFFLCDLIKCNLLLPPVSGECCPRCTPTPREDCPTPTDCTGVRCPMTSCKGENLTLVSPQCGQCCLTCVDWRCTIYPNCTGVECPKFLCADNSALVIECGECCPRCQPPHLAPTI